MAIDANILLQGRVPDAVGAIGQGYQLGQAVRQAPIRNQLLQQQADAGKLQMDAETAKFQLSDAATDALQIKPLLNSPEQASAMFQRRIEKIKARGGDPSDTIGVWQLYQSGDVQGANAELDAVIGAAEKAGLLGKGNADNSYYTTVQTSSGVYRFNNRTGQYEPMAGPDGKPVLPTAADPNVASAKRGAELRQDLAYKPQIAESVAQSEADVALRTKPKIEAETAAEKTKAKAGAQAQLDLPQTVANAEYSLNVLDQMLKHPGLDAATGTSSRTDPRNFIPGTDAYNFNVLKDQVQGQTFLQAFQTLKGAGQITEVEGTKAQNAIARMNTAQSKEEFVKAVEEFKGVIAKGLDQARKKAATTGQPQAQQPAQGGKQGGQIMIDANGNRAMVYPDGSFEEMP